MRIKREPLIIGGFLAFFGFVIGKLIQPSAVVNPLDLYQQGLIEIFAGIIGLLGWITISVALLTSFIVKPFGKYKCPKCGTIVSERTDKFCRICGETLS